MNGFFAKERLCTRCRCYRRVSMFSTHEDGSLYSTCDRCRLVMRQYQQTRRRAPDNDRRRFCRVGVLPKNAKLAAEDIPLIMALRNRTGRHGEGVLTCKEVAEKFGVSTRTIYGVWQGITYSAFGSGSAEEKP